MNVIKNTLKFTNIYIILLKIKFTLVTPSSCETAEAMEGSLMRNIFGISVYSLFVKSYIKIKIFNYYLITSKIFYEC